MVIASLIIKSTKKLHLKLPYGVGDRYYLNAKYTNVRETDSTDNIVTEGPDICV